MNAHPTDERSLMDTPEQVDGTGSRFRRVAELLFDGNKSDLARALDMKPGSFGKYLRDKRRPGARILGKLHRAGVNINWFLSGEGPALRPDFSDGGPATSGGESPTSGPETDSTESDWGKVTCVRIPTVRVRLADSGTLQYDEAGDAAWLSRRSIQVRYGVDPDRLRDFRVSSNRMATTIQVGDRVRVERKPADLPMSKLEDGEVYLLFGPDGVFPARVRLQVSGPESGQSGILLDGDNPEASQYEVSTGDWTRTYCPIARVLEVVRPV